jgi:hypothetical protein
VVLSPPVSAATTDVTIGWLTSENSENMQKEWKVHTSSRRS